MNTESTTERIDPGRGGDVKRNTVIGLTRAELVQEVMWNSGGTGTGMGLVMAAMGPPRSKEQDWRSIVAVSGPPESYTTVELRRIVAFARRVTARYDKMFRYRMGANLVCLSKRMDPEGPSWMRKRLSWEMGPMFSVTLSHAFEVIEHPIGGNLRKDVVRAEQKERARRARLAARQRARAGVS